MSDFAKVVLVVQVSCLAAMTILSIIAPSVVPMLVAAAGIVAFQVALSH